HLGWRRVCNGSASRRRLVASGKSAMGGPESDRDEVENLEGELDDVPLTDGQVRRIRLLESALAEVCERIGAICVTSALDVTDVAVLVVAPSARRFVFGGADTDADYGGAGEPAIIARSRQDLYAALSACLPPTPECYADPYADLKEQAPTGCARVVVVDHAG